MDAFLKSLAFVFLSEMGDKTQIVSFAFGASFGLPVVFLGIFLGVATLMAITVGVGAVAAAFIPLLWINIASGILFVLFGLWALKEHEEESTPTVGEKFGPIVAVMATFFLAELGDKTVLASITVSSQFHSYFPVWAGSTLGMYLADVIAVICGRVLGKRLPDRLVRYASAAIFIGAGAWTLWQALWHSA